MVASSPSAKDSGAHAWAAFADAAAGDLARFERSLEQPAVAQAAVFREVLGKGADSAFGRAQRFADIETPEQFRERVPVSRWSDYAAWVERAKSESQGVLTSELPLHFERTSGSTAHTKDIPYTPALLSQLQRGLVAWLAKLYAACPEVAGPAWWSLSPQQTASTRAPNGIPIGCVSDATYLQGSAAEALLPTVIDAHDALAADDWKTNMLAVVAACSNLRLISVWSPTFLSSLLGVVVDEDRRAVAAPRLRQRLPQGRYRALMLAAEARDFSALWPELRIVSAWTDGPSAQYAQRVAQLFPQAQLVPKGLFATEGIVSLSWGVSELRPLAVESHFLEFLDDQGGPRLVDELIVGRHYEPVLTTGGGLYRYALGDLVEVTGFVGRTPAIRFVGRVDLRSDLVGEKLDADIVSAAFDRAGLTEPAVLVPVVDAEQPHYVLLIESASAADAETRARRLDGALGDCFHYGIARRNGQLAALATATTEDLASLLHSAWEALAKRSGDAKPASLIASSALAREVLARCRAPGSVYP